MCTKPTRTEMGKTCDDDYPCTWSLEIDKNRTRWTGHMIDHVIIT